MLHNSGGFGPGGNPSNTNFSEKTHKVCTPPNIGHNMENLCEIARQQLRTTTERYDVPTHGSYNYELSSYSSNLGTFSAYQNRRQPDMCDPNTARRHDLNWEGSLPTHMHSVPFQNMPHFVPQFETPRINTEHRSQCISNSQNPDHRHIDNYYNKYNSNKDIFNNYNQSFTTQESCKMDVIKQKKLENTVKLIDDIIANSSNQNNAAEIPNCNEKQIQDNCDSTNMLNGLLLDQGIQHSHYKKPYKMEINPQLEKIKPNIYHQEEVQFEHSSNDNRSLDKDVTELHKWTSERDKNSVNKDAPHQDLSSVENERKIPNDSINIGLKENNNNPKINEQIIKTNDLIETETEEKQSKSLNDDVGKNDNDLPNEHETFLPKTELHIDNDSKIEIDADENLNDKESTENENNFSAIFLRDPNMLSSKDVKKGTVIVNFVSTVEEATGTKTLKCVYECKYCNYYFHHPKRFLIHVKWHTFGLASDKRHDIARQQGLEKEKQQCKSAPPPPTHHCEYCQKKFKTLNSLTNHKQRFHPAEPPAPASPSPPERERFVCARAACRRVCTNKYTLAKHMRTHMEKHISCPAEQCGKLFATPAQLRDHRRVHERVARGPVYKCKHCPKSFYQTYNLNAHEKTHSNERPFECDICSTRFATNSSLKRHLKVSHSASKPFPCTECGRCFAEWRTLMGHVSKAHPSTSAHPTSNTPPGGAAGKAASKITTRSRPRKGKRGRKSKKADDRDTSDERQSDVTDEYI